MISKSIESLEQINVFHTEGSPLTAIQILPGSESPDLSLSIIGLSGINERVLNLESNATYSVIAGCIYMITWVGEDFEITKLVAGESKRIPAGTWYQDRGTALMVSKNHVAFTADKVQREPKQITLRSIGDTVVIKELTLEDAEPYFTLIAADTEHLSQHGDVTAKKYTTVQKVEESILHPTNPMKFRFGIWDHGVMVGSVNLTPNEDKKGETGSWVGKEHLGHNYAQRARILLIDFAFSKLHLDELVSDIVLGNEPSRKSVEKSGYSFKEFIVKDDRVHWRYSLSRSEWLNQKTI